MLNTKFHNIFYSDFMRKITIGNAVNTFERRNVGRVNIAFSRIGPRRQQHRTQIQGQVQRPSNRAS